MVFTIRHHIFRPVGVVLQKRNGANEVDTGREHNKHRPAVGIADQPCAQLVPAAHGAAGADAGVVGRTEPDLAAGTGGDALGDRGTAVLGERGRIKHAVGDALALLALGDALADFLGMQF